MVAPLDIYIVEVHELVHDNVRTRSTVEDITDDMQANQTVSEQTKIRQGWLESSNIDVNREYAMVMEAQRAFQACSSALQIIDQIDQKSASEIASL